MLFLLALLTFGCDKDNEINPIECDFTYTISSSTLSEGDELIIEDILIKPIVPSSGVVVRKVEFFLGNRKIGMCEEPPYKLDYKIPELPEGEHILQIDIHLSAEGYDNTTVWHRRNIKIINIKTT